MWSKGAVVIVKHGDAEMADAITEGMSLQVIPPSQDILKLERDYAMLKRRDKRYWKRKIARANKLYSTPQKVTPKWLKPFTDLGALLLYGISIFVDKFMTIHEV